MTARRLSLALLLILCLAGPALAAAPDPATRPEDFVDVGQLIPQAQMDIRYFSPHNFVGRPIAGYEAPKCLLTRRAAQALAQVEAELAPMGLTLKIYDCYRPQRAVNDFVRWAQDPSDVLTKREFYPTLEKSVLFPQGYIAQRSGHSRGSTLDLTIAPLPLPPQAAWDAAQQVECFRPAAQRFADGGLDMGTGFDCFHPAAHTKNPATEAQARANRALLLRLMEHHGFKNLEEEWWHYTLRDEPYPDTYFNFPVR